VDRQGLEIVDGGHRARLKWHRLRRRMSDALFSAEVMRSGLALGASMELDLRVRADGGFVVLHNETLDGETTGYGSVAEKSIDDLHDIRMKEGGRPLVLTEDLSALLQSAHPEALLQFDMKDDYRAIGEKGIAHLTRHFQNIATSVVVSGASLELIVAIKDKLPYLKRGIDPTDKLVEIYRDRGLKAVEADLLCDIRGPTEPDTIYLHWPLILRAAKQGLDLIALCRSENKLVDAWTFTPKDPEHGFSDAEWHDFSALMALKPAQITTDEAPATEEAWLKRRVG
jgi:glycerophosphoryl diester phosphodiesterase